MFLKLHQLVSGFKNSLEYRKISELFSLKFSSNIALIKKVNFENVFTVSTRCISLTLYPDEFSLDRHFSDHKTLFPVDTYASDDEESANKYFYQAKDDDSDFHMLTFLAQHVRYTLISTNETWKTFKRAVCGKTIESSIY